MKPLALLIRDRATEGRLHFFLIFFLSLGLMLQGQPTEIPEEPAPETVEAPAEDPPNVVEEAPAENPGDAPVPAFFYLDGISTRAFIDNENYINPSTSQNFGIINTSVIIEGAAGAEQTVVWRGRGPSINLAVPRATDPSLNVAQVGGGSLAVNSSYLDDPNLSIIEGTPLIPGNIDAAEGIATTTGLGGGAYSVRVTSPGDTSGVAIGEAFAFFAEVPTAEPAVKLTGISTRAPVGNGANQSMNASFIILGEATVNVVCRGRGPSINLPEGVTKLPDPLIELVRAGEGVIATNDSYLTAANLSLIEGTPFIPDGIEESEAILVALDLSPGAYSLRLRNADNTEPGTGGAGIGIVEVLLFDPAD